MKIEALARQLRKHLRKRLRAIHPQSAIGSAIGSTPDREIVNCYITDPQTGVVLVPWDFTEKAISMAQSAQEWMALNHDYTLARAAHNIDHAQPIRILEGSDSATAFGETMDCLFAEVN